MVSRCLELANDTRRVIDASESSVEGRESALAALQALGQPSSPLEGLLIYVPARSPLTDEEKQRDPFALYGVCGAVFPESDGDEYLSLCLRYKADHATEVRRVFAENPKPTFAMIDAIGSGTGWPQLQALLAVESARDLLFALLVPSEAQREALKGQEAWIAEAKALCESALSLRLTTRAKSWGPVAEELWRFLLFSEFIFDLPVALPAALADVPRAYRRHGRWWKISVIGCAATSAPKRATSSAPKPSRGSLKLRGRLPEHHGPRRARHLPVRRANVLRSGRRCASAR